MRRNVTLIKLSEHHLLIQACAYVQADGPGAATAASHARPVNEPWWLATSAGELKSQVIRLHGYPLSTTHGEVGLGLWQASVSVWSSLLHVCSCD